MKQIISVRSNCMFSIPEEGKLFSVKPVLELVIIHTDGKNYKLGKDNFVESAKLSEVRLMVSPEMLDNLITDLQLHQTKLSTIRKNGDQINSLIRHISEEKTDTPNDQK